MHQLGNEQVPESAALYPTGYGFGVEGLVSDTTEPECFERVIHKNVTT